MKLSQHNSQLFQFNYLMDPVDEMFWSCDSVCWWSWGNWSLLTQTGTFLHFCSLHEIWHLTRIMDWRRRWDIYCTLLSWLSIVVGRGYLHYVHYPHLHMRNVTGNCLLMTLWSQCPMLHSFAHFMRTAAGRSGRSLVVRGAVPAVRGVSASWHFWRGFGSLLNNLL